jgi:hypothetical protein
VCDAFERASSVQARSLGDVRKLVLDALGNRFVDVVAILNGTPDSCQHVLRCRYPTVSELIAVERVRSFSHALLTRE